MVINFFGGGFDGRYYYIKGIEFWKYKYRKINWEIEVNLLNYCLLIIVWWWNSIGNENIFGIEKVWGLNFLLFR